MAIAHLAIRYRLDLHMKQERSTIDGALARIAEREPQLQALVPEARRRERLLADLATLPVATSLDGLLIGVKDIFHVDGWQTRAGSGLPPEVLTGPESGCVAQLKTAGALVLAKTVTTEFAYFEPGPTCNPHHPAHTPGGSSSGSAAAVAAGYCRLALGTQTVGSVIRPAAFCGVVGFKPSYDRVSTTGLLYYSPAVDTVGWFTPDLAGALAAAEILCREWRRVEALAKPVLGVPEGPFLEQASPEGLAAFASQIRQLQASGYMVRRVQALADIAEVNERHTRLISGEVARQHEDLFRDYADMYRPRTAALIRDGQQISEADIALARDGRMVLRKQLQADMAVHGIDIWICPSALGPAPMGLETTGDPAMNLPWTHAGLPALNLPAGCAKNALPLGLQCIAGWQRDEELLWWGQAMAEVFN